METRVKRVGEESSFSEIGRSSLQMVFMMRGTVKAPVLIFKNNGIITVQYILLEEEDAEELHQKLLYTIVELIRRLDPPELFVGYEAFYVMEEKAVRVLVGTHYSDEGEQVWLAQTHEGTVGEWQDISDNPNRFGFEGLWNLAKSYLRN